MLWVLIAGGVAYGPAVAQTSAPAAPATPSAADRAAMERALQQADGPRRRILEAARLKAEQTPAPAPAPVAATGRPAVAASPAPATVAAVRPSDVATPAPNAAAATATLGPTVAPLALPETARVDSVAKVAPVEAVIAPRVDTAALGEAPPRVMDDLQPPKLLKMVEPELPARLFRRTERRVELVVDLVINRDGSVRSAAVRGDPGTDVESAVVDAMRRWRYDPQPGARMHVVRLVASPS